MTDRSDGPFRKTDEELLLRLRTLLVMLYQGENDYAAALPELISIGRQIDEGKL